MIKRWHSHKNLVPETYTNVFPHVIILCLLSCASFFWHQKLAQNRTQLYLVQVSDTGIKFLMRETSTSCLQLSGKIPDRCKTRCKQCYRGDSRSETCNRNLQRCTWPKLCSLTGRLCLKVSGTTNLYQIQLCSIWCWFLVQVSWAFVTAIRQDVNNASLSQCT